MDAALGTKLGGFIAGFENLACETNQFMDDEDEFVDAVDGRDEEEEDEGLSERDDGDAGEDDGGFGDDDFGDFGDFNEPPESEDEDQVHDPDVETTAQRERIHIHNPGATELHTIEDVSPPIVPPLLIPLANREIS